MCRRPRVMVLEPNPLIAELLRSVLRAFELEFAEPEDFLDLVYDRRPDLVIMEILLRGTDGLEICRSLKEREATSSVPVVVFSVLDAREEALEAGADAFLLKPAERGGLLREVRRLTCGQPPAPRCD